MDPQMRGLITIIGANEFNESLGQHVTRTKIFSPVINPDPWRHSLPSPGAPSASVPAPLSDSPAPGALQNVDLAGRTVKQRLTDAVEFTKERPINLAPLGAGLVAGYFLYSRRQTLGGILAATAGTLASAAMANVFK